MPAVQQQPPRGALRYLTVAHGATHPATEDIVAALVSGQVRVRGIAVEAASLEDRFVALTGEGFDVVR